MKKEYKKYCQKINKIGAKPLSYKDWKRYQPICDEALTITNKIIKYV